MTSIVGFLQGVGASASLRHATGEELHEALKLDAIEPEARAAILATDRPALEAITGCRVIAHKVITPGKDDEEEEDAPRREDEEVHAALADVLATA